MDLNRFDWLALRREEAIDPDRVIVDAHHHLWEGRLGTYLAPQLLDDLTASHNVVKTVFVDCMSNYDRNLAEHMQPVGETAFVASQADSTDAAGGPTIAGIVSHANLMLGNAVDEVLAAHDAAGRGRFRGIRHATGWDASDEIYNSHSRPFQHMMGTDEFRAGARQLARMRFSFDAWLFHPQLPDLAALAEAVPELTIVLNHLGGPLGIGPYGRMTATGLAPTGGRRCGWWRATPTWCSRWAASEWTCTTAWAGRHGTCSARLRGGGRSLG